MYPELASTHPPELKIERSKIQVQAIQETLDETVDLLLIQIPGGEFMMGSPDDEEEREDSEGPQHHVSVPNFWMGQYPITQAQWWVVAQYERVNQDLDPDPSKFKGDHNPVEQISWNDAVEFCERLSLRTGRSYRLPTEAEWEYACRAGTTTPFHFGATLSAQYSNYDARETYGPGEIGEYRQKTTPIDHFQIGNAFGLYDMHGNVWEWCLDRWHNNYVGAPNTAEAWPNDEEAFKKNVLRGGAWECYPSLCRSASREGYNCNVKLENLSFRIALHS
ncbi:formylglycine-generating enzyme family protein [Acaryochloris sp. IP29b_bin.148]|uniref:formylglycine-generating enzyme family protein n=1 Tax=Acaryochloris sp. IP29b_bin.148 TaxID=2969218 RepID=UPI00262D1AE4|nr:formylglycine-generating enzyme family protein [Acaryochloris sp. IP29b_bin.148]